MNRYVLYALTIAAGVVLARSHCLHDLDIGLQRPAQAGFRNVTYKTSNTPLDRSLVRGEGIPPQFADNRVTSVQGLRSVRDKFGNGNAVERPPDFCCIESSSVTMYGRRSNKLRNIEKVLDLFSQAGPKFSRTSKFKSVLLVVLNAAFSSAIERLPVRPATSSIRGNDVHRRP